ncbi:putative repeat protein (TIGR01451 family), partial [Breznakia sp. PFB2-8]|nr:putative repeat protein (TIGR01451 family) [Breznakia sp. PFB2-8]
MVKREKKKGNLTSYFYKLFVVFLAAFMMLTSLPTEIFASANETSSQTVEKTDASVSNSNESNLNETTNLHDEDSNGNLWLSFMRSPLKPRGNGDAPDYGQVSAVRFTQADQGLLSGLALDTNGKVWTWGYNEHGIQGCGYTATGMYNGGMKRIPYFTENDINIVSIESGYYTAYAIDDKGQVYVWGRGIEGQMGDGSNRSVNQTPKPIAALSGVKIRKIVTGIEAASHTYAMAEDGRIFAWGYADNNRIPNSGVYVTTPKEMTSLNGLNIVDISLGDAHCMFLSKDGKVYTQGYGYQGRLGHGNTTNVNYPKEVEWFANNNKKVVQISASTNSSLALTEDGKIYQWGHIATSVGGFTTMLTPTEVGIDLTSNPYGYTPEWQKIICGRYTSYVIDTHGRVWSWGSNVFYSFSTDGPMAPANVGAGNPDPTRYGKLHEVRLKATMQPLTMGDGDTQEYIQAVKGPVFSNWPTSGAYGTYMNETINTYRWWGNFSDIANGMHPTIYDKKYCKTVGEFSNNNPTTLAALATAHSKVYLVDEKDRRLVYVVRKDGASTISGNYYVAEDSYTGTWLVDNRSTYDLPSGVTEETSVPAIKEKEKGWIGLAVDLETHNWTGHNMKQTPYMIDISTYQSSSLYVDASGNLYKTTYDGAGAIAWGWDNELYDLHTGSVRPGEGLYNKYNHELVFMRGAPMVTPVDVTIQKSTSKIYQTEGNTKSDKVTVKADIPAAYVDEDMNIKFTSDLRDVKYVFVPYDKSNPDFNIADDELTIDQFNAMYNNSAYTKKADLLDDTISGGDDGKEWKDEIEITENGRIYVLTVDNAYGKVTNTLKAYTADNFYTPAVIEHVGNGYVDGKIYEEIYAPTSENVTKTKEGTDTSDVYGVPLDAKGNVIENPTFGYDKVKVEKYDVLPNGEDKYWLFSTPQDGSLSLTLDDKKYVDEDFTHEFKYERNPSGWITISYEGKDIDSGLALPAFSMDPNPEIVKIDKELTRTPPEISDYEILGYNVNTDKTIYNLDSSGDLVYTPTEDTVITFLYGTWSENSEKTVVDKNGDGYASPGEELTYTLTYENEGSGSAKNVLIQDELKTVLPYVEDPKAGSVTVNNNGAITTHTVQDLIDGIPIDKIAGKTKVTVVFKVKVKADLDVDTVKEIVNKSTVGESIILTGKAELQSAKKVVDASGDGVASPGEKLTYTIISKNNGPADASDLLVKDEMTGVVGHINETPSAVNINVTIDGAPVGNYTLQDLIDGITIDKLAKDKTLSVSFAVTVKDDLDVSKVNKIANTATVGDTKPTIEIPTGKVELSTSKTVSDASGDNIAAPGEELTYVITAKNNGSATSSELTLKDELTNV